LLVLVLVIANLFLFLVVFIIFHALIIAVIVVLILIAVVILIVLGDFRIIAFRSIAEILLQPAGFVLCWLAMSCHSLFYILADVYS
jgi:hypothetical protein